MSICDRNLNMELVYDLFWKLNYRTSVVWAKVMHMQEFRREGSQSMTAIEILMKMSIFPLVHNPNVVEVNKAQTYIQSHIYAANNRHH